MLAIGGGHYRGETGYAVGFSSISDGGNWIIKGTASGNSRGHFWCYRSSWLPMVI